MNKKPGSLAYEEIYMQPESLEGVLKSLPEIKRVLKEVLSENFDEFIFIGCGTSFYLAQTAAFAFAQQTGMAAKAVPCSEMYLYPDAYIKSAGKTLVVPFFRNSDTSEVRLSVNRIRGIDGVKTLAISCDPRGSFFNDYIILSPDADEKSVIMTRSFSSMILIAMIFAFYAAGRFDEIQALENLPREAKTLLPLMDDLAKHMIEDNPNLTLYVTLAQGVYFGIANENGNKMKEMALVDAESYHSMEFRHGPMSLTSSDTLVVVLSAKEAREQDLKLVKQLAGYGAIVAVVGADLPAETGARYCLNMPEGFTDVQLAPVISFLGQLMGYHISIKKGIDADTPRHLSMAITF